MFDSTPWRRRFAPVVIASLWQDQSLAAVAPNQPLTATSLPLVEGVRMREAVRQLRPVPKPVPGPSAFAAHDREFDGVVKVGVTA
jgi:hypothetical protein